MAELSISDTAFAGFRVVQRKPATLFYWFAFSLLAFIGIMMIVAAFMGSAVIEMVRAGAALEQNPAAIIGLIGRVFLGVLLLIPLALIFSAMRSAAANRAVLWPEDSALGYLRFGADEFRLVVVLFVIGFFNLVAQFAASLIFGAFGLVLGVSTMNSGDPSGLIAFRLLSSIPTYALIIFLGVKFSLAPALTLDGKAIDIFGSWSLTKGHFWRIFLTYLIDYLMVIGVVIVAGIIVFSAVLVSGLNLASMADKLESNPAALIGALTSTLAPLFAVVCLVGGLVSALTTMIMFCPAAAIYSALTNRSQAEVF